MWGLRGVGSAWADLKSELPAQRAALLRLQDHRLSAHHLAAQRGARAEPDAFAGRRAAQRPGGGDELVRPALLGLFHDRNREPCRSPDRSGGGGAAAEEVAEGATRSSHPLQRERAANVRQRLRQNCAELRRIAQNCAARRASAGGELLLAFRLQHLVHLRGGKARTGGRQVLRLRRAAAPPRHPERCDPSWGGSVPCVTQVGAAVSRV